MGENTLQLTNNFPFMYIYILKQKLIGQMR